MAPAEKKQKLGDGSAAPVTTVAEEELEKDAAAAKLKQKLPVPVAFNVSDTTLNVMPSASNGMLKLLSEGPLASYIGGARANVGFKAGRYMFEVKVIECLKGQKQKPSLKIGVATGSSSLLLGDGEDNVCFDSNAGFVHNGQKSPVGRGFANSGSVIAVVVNLDKKSPNCNTISLFRDGVRAAPPQPLPESLVGKPLFPALSFGLLTVHVNFGPEPLTPLPFTCRMPQGADETDVSIASAPKEGKCEVLYPIALPGEGGFDWLDQFLEKNPGYTELSDRALTKWAEKSGMQKRPAKSNDKPEAVDDLGTLRRLVGMAATLQPRNYVVMELRGNLLKDDRARLLAQFPDSDFKKVAGVLVGEPTPDFKKREKELMLQDKQAASDITFRAEQLKEKAKKAAEKKQREAARAAKKAAKEREKKLLEAKKKLEASKKKEGDEEKKEEEEPAKEESEDEKSEPEVEEPEASPPTVELDDEEKKVVFRKTPLPDLTDRALSGSFTQFSLPGKDEGFESIKFLWSKGPQAEAYIKDWILSRKVTTRLEDLAPSAWFHVQWGRWQKVLREWQTKQANYGQMLAKKESDKRAKAIKREQEKRKKEIDRKLAIAKKEGEKKRKEMERKKKVEEAQKKGEEPPPEEPEEEEEKEPEPVVEEPEEEEEEVSLTEEDFEALDVFGVEDVCDVEGEVPLFKEFLNEDWVMASLRFELHLLAHAFRRDVNDPDRSGVYLEHLGFYYQKYFKKPLSLAAYGADSAEALVELAADTVQVSKQVMESSLPEELEEGSLGLFVKLAEESRRHRKLLVDSGDETAKLKIAVATAAGGAAAPAQQKPAPVQPGLQQKPQQQSQANKDGGKGGGKASQGNKAQWRSQPYWNRW
eukprot:TRINITY_DN55_c0_g1_i1.p1 TRINITY_DN55_c0_g1~~TRINITY_DN55_c0_g1_i1.p1  ORF type:complete len:891 (+),score=345.70 TRINITY_DN55_c0_g1_i1:63-2675(+)